MPIQDPENYSLISYVANGLLSIWGGVAAYIISYRNGRAWSWIELILQVVISGFAGMLAMILCWHLQAPTSIAGFAAGVSGLMGSKILSFFENKALVMMRLTMKDKTDE